MKSEPGRLVKRDAEVCIQAIRKWCERFFENLSVKVLDQEDPESPSEIVVPSGYATIKEFLELCRDMNLILTPRQARHMAYHLQSNGRLETFETRALMHSWAPDVVLHITNSDDYFKTMQSTMIEVMNDMRQNFLHGEKREKASMAKSINSICRDLVVMEERRRMTVDSTAEVGHDPNTIIEQQEQQLLEDQQENERRQKRIEEAKIAKQMAFDKADEEKELILPPVPPSIDVKEGDDNVTGD